MAKLREKYFTDTDLSDEINMTDIRKKVIDKHGNFFKFKSDDTRHDVMYAFVTECLVEDSDLEFFLTTASPDVISEYCRSWNYKRIEGERCLYVPDEPEKMYELFIDKLQLDIITHCTVSDEGIHVRISKRLNIPEEIFSWDLSAKKRFVENSKLGRVEMFHARGMVVGCAGAGKTTLLRRLQRKKRKNKNKSTETTKGIEVHEDLFEIKDNTLIDSSDDNTKMLINGLPSDKKLISMTDFAGQVAYYACHQVYLSRRAFYIVVIDMSKGLDEKACKHNVDRHNPQGSLFQAWNYRDYFHFWLQSIKTYCDEGDTQAKERNEGGKGVFHPVILIASHKDKVSWRRKEESFYGQLEKCLSEKQTLKELISVGRYFEVECPEKSLTNKQKEKIEKVKKCIVET
ncbi:probable serine/threonine-protein kinase pats1, partial [Saccostrea cucullata]|uniref:probable serine/threonine-protein kinase pats1 n=1 Tax=Saccostrea cuccullata TaxID=36930 RepID=UPI002ED13023